LLQVKAKPKSARSDFAKASSDRSDFAKASSDASAGNILSMWQRIQSVFLGLVLLSLILGLLVPVWAGAGEGIEYRLYPIYFMVKQQGQITTSQYFPFCITAMLMTAAVTLAIMEFRRYDNRLLQVKLGTLNSLILAGVMICDVVFSNQLSKGYPVPWKFDLSLYLTFAAVACNWLAIRFIRRDEKLVSDSDRLR
jgi:hypothetical protein